MPTCRELAAMGLASERIDGNGRAYFAVSNAGHRLLGEVMARNGERAREWRAAR